MSMELLNMMASMLSEEQIVDQLEEAIQEYKIKPCDDTFQKISTVGVMCSFKTMQNANGGGFEGMVKMNSVLQKAEKLNNLGKRLEGDKIDKS